MKTKLLKLSEIVTTTGTQIRAKIDGDTVDQYAEAMRDATNKFPPVVVFHDGSQFILADGFHRVMAASRNGFLDIEADVRKGTHSDALKFALAANSTHGLKRTVADKRRSVELALTEWPRLSNREMAKICAVSDMFVATVRNELQAACSSPAPQTRIGADGKERKLPKKNFTTGGAGETASPEKGQSNSNQAADNADALNPGSDAPAPGESFERSEVHSADEQLADAFDRVKFSKQVEKDFRAWLDKRYSEAQLPFARNAIRAFLAKSETIDGYTHKPF